MQLTVELLHPDAQAPKRATEGSAGYDLCAYLRGRTIKVSMLGHVSVAHPRAGESAVTFVLPPGRTALVALAFKARMPDAIEAQTRPRSGTSFKKGLTIPNAPGTI